MTWRKIGSVIRKSLNPKNSNKDTLGTILNLSFFLALRGMCGSKTIEWAEAGSNSVQKLCELLLIACKQPIWVLDTTR